MVLVLECHQINVFCVSLQSIEYKLTLLEWHDGVVMPMD